ncbi:hypothetical protein [Deinococcus roseus]|uniref:Cadherin domain-containing protein n=1 Tax=Deinococcus roseus TaxID=392414 RepID=A0ABQ2DEH8_9DEIO|nr:hypothetical protein [Deinococcus roseus]GGJ53750.1 hypothetical protein GCM10008938_44720 [Deinococcus roseus]
MRKRYGALLALTTLLAACGSTPRVNSTPVQPNPPSQGKKFQILGYVQVTLGENAKVQWFGANADGSINKQGVANAAYDLQLVQNATPYNDFAGTRYLYSTFKVRNGFGAITWAQASNIVFLGADDDATIDHTAVLSMRDSSNVQFKDSTVANSIIPAHRMLDATTANPSFADMYVLPEALVAPFHGAYGAYFFPWGFAVRHCLNTSCTDYDRTLPGNPTLTQYDGRVTFSYKVPVGPRTPRSVDMLFVAGSEAPAVVVQTEDEQSSDRVAGLVTPPAGFGVIKMRGSSLSGGTLMQNIRITGMPGAPEVLISRNDHPTDLDLSATSVASYTDAAVVGNLTVIDNTPGDSFSYSLSDSRFEVVAGVLKLKAGKSITAAPTSIPLQITVTDQAGGSYSETFNLAVSPAGGLLDNTFGTNGLTTTSISAHPTTPDDQGFGLDIQQQGGNAGKTILVGQTYVTATSIYDFAIARYDSNGILDTTFGTNGILKDNISTSAADTDIAKAVKVIADDSFLVAGVARGGSTTDADFALVKYTATGSRDTTFGTGGKVLTNMGTGAAADGGNALAVQSDGKIVVAGFTTSSTSGKDFALARYNSNGTLDTTFGTGGKRTDAISASNGADEITGVAIDSNGKIVVSGYTTVSTFTKFVVARYNSNGTPDTTFNTTGRTVTPINANNDRANAIVLQPDGKIVVAGTSILTAGSNEDFVAVRYTTSGALDTSFGNAGITQISFGSNIGQEQANGLDLQADGKIVLAGRTRSSGGNYDLAMVRLTTAGALDSTFGKSGRVVTVVGPNSDTGQAIKVWNNKIYLAGTSFVTGNNNDYALARYIP